MLRGWRGRDSFDGNQPPAWLYRIATNVCLDVLRRNARQASAARSARRAFKFDVLRIVRGRIAEITTFGPQLFPAFNLPPTLA